MLQSFRASKKTERDTMHMDVIAQTPGLEKWQGVYYRVYLYQHENVLVTTNKRGGGKTQFRHTKHYQEQTKKWENETCYGRSKAEPRLNRGVILQNSDRVIVI